MEQRGPDELSSEELSSELAAKRARAWAATMDGFHGEGSEVRLAHGDGGREIGKIEVFGREERESREADELASLATRSFGAGNRVRSEPPDPYRSAFERDRDRILHSSAFRRLAGKTQVFVFPDDHQRTRLTHALEVAQVARAVASALRLNVALAEAIALGHDCGHGPGGHASEDALSPYLERGFNHAVFGADVTLAPLNLTFEVLDGIRNHSWSRPAPLTPEGEVVSWADRIAYVCHDFEDAVSAGIVTPEELPHALQDQLGAHRGQQLGVFIEGLINSSAGAGAVAMDASLAELLSVFRRFNYERIYLRDESKEQARAVVEVLQRLVDWLLAEGHAPLEAVRDVAAMTDRYAFDLAVRRLDYPPSSLPRGIDAAEVDRR